MKPYKYLSLLFFLALTMLSGCIEHYYRIDILEDESLNILYRARGDVMDFSDSGQLLPDSTTWEFKTWMEDGEDAAARVMEYKTSGIQLDNLQNQLDWSNIPADSIHLKRTFSLVRSKQLFGISWKFSGKLYSRHFNKLYGDIWDFVPEECRVLESEEATSGMSSEEIEMLEQRFSLGILQWNLSRYAKKFDRVWEQVIERIPDIPDTSSSVVSISKAGWIEDLHIYLNNTDISDPNTVNLDWWNDLRPVFLGRIVDITGHSNLEEIADISDAFEKQYQVTKDIEDDIYRFVINMPGRVLYTNGVRNEDDMLSWEISGKSLLEDDGIILLDTFEVSLWRVGAAAFVVLVVVGFLRRRFRKIKSVNNNG